MRRQSRVLLVLGAAALLAARNAAPAESEEPSLDLEGAWRLERKENFEEYLKASGAPWWKRKLAQIGSSRMKQTIAIRGLHVAVTSESPVETRTLSFVADGATETSAEAATGDRMTWTATLVDGVLVVDGHGDLGHRKIRREVVDGTLVMTITNLDADARCRLFFERAEAD